MKKLKIFLVAASLVLVTAGVFAGKSKFTTSYELYGWSSGLGYNSLVPMTIGAGGQAFVLSTTTPAATVSYSGTTYTLYAYNTTDGYYYVQF